MAEDWQAGNDVGDRYRLVAPLAQGGGGELWRADDLTSQAQVAVKLLSRDLVGDEAMEARFRREARAVAALRGPHIVRVLDSGVHRGVPFMAMELLHGESLRERLERSSPLSWQETKRILLQIGRGVAQAHDAGVVHRDVKPANIFLAGEDDALQVKILDFGVAKVGGSLAQTALRTQTGDMLGTPHYMSPEQLRGSKAVDGRADLWALGVIAYECLLGSRPFVGKTLGDLVLRTCIEPPPVPSSQGRVPEGFDAWFARTIARKLEDRFQTCDELVSALGAIDGARQ